MTIHSVAQKGQTSASSANGIELGGRAHGSSAPESTPKTRHNLSKVQTASPETSSSSSASGTSGVSTASHDGDDRSNASRDPFSADSSPSAETPRERADRLGLKIDAEMAQLIFPPSACVFIANLIATKSDEEIAYAVKVAFGAFGCCWVKVKRDAQNMPYAFCQYESPDAARIAIAEMADQLILGRPCRTEQGKVERSLYLSRVAGGSISDSQAREILAHCGDIERVYACTPAELAMFKLPEGVFVKFTHFGTARQAAEKFKNHATFSLCQPTLPSKMHANLENDRAARIYSRSPVRYAQTIPASRSYRPGTASIFVGNITMSTTAADLISIFRQYGRIRNVEIVYRPTITGGSVVWAFVDFESSRAADAASHAEPMLANVRLRVERRQTTPLSLLRNCVQPAGPRRLFAHVPVFPSNFGHFGQMAAPPQFMGPGMHTGPLPFTGVPPPPMMYNGGGFVPFGGFPVPQYGPPHPVPAFGPAAMGSGSTSSNTS